MNPKQLHYRNGYCKNWLCHETEDIDTGLYGTDNTDFNHIDYERISQKRQISGDGWARPCADRTLGWLEQGRAAGQAETSGKNSCTDTWKVYGPASCVGFLWCFDSICGGRYRSELETCRLSGCWICRQCQEIRRTDSHLYVDGQTWRRFASCHPEICPGPCQVIEIQPQWCFLSRRALPLRRSRRDSSPVPAGVLCQWLWVCALAVASVHFLSECQWGWNLCRIERLWTGFLSFGRISGISRSESQFPGTWCETGWTAEICR